jgi:hypothetical protein
MTSSTRGHSRRVESPISHVSVTSFRTPIICPLSSGAAPFPDSCLNDHGQIRSSIRRSHRLNIERQIIALQEYSSRPNRRPDARSRRMVFGNDGGEGLINRVNREWAFSRETEKSGGGASQGTHGLPQRFSVAGKERIESFGNVWRNWGYLAELRQAWADRWRQQMGGRGSERNNLAPHTGHVSNCCGPVGGVIEPVDAFVFRVMGAARRRLLDRAPSLDTSRTRQETQGNFRSTPSSRI